MQLTVLRALSQSELPDPLGESDTVIEFTELQARVLRALERRPTISAPREPALIPQLPAPEEPPEVPCIDESERAVLELEPKKKKRGHAQARTQELGSDPRSRRQEIRSTHRSGFYVCLSGKKSIRTLHKLGKCCALPDVDYLRYEYMGT